MKKSLIAGIIVLLIIAGGIWYYFSTDRTVEVFPVVEEVELVEDGVVVESEDEDLVSPEMMEMLEEQNQAGLQDDEISDDDIRMIEEILEEITRAVE